MTVDAARDALHRAVNAESEASREVRNARRALYLAMRRDFDARLAAESGASVSFERLAELGMPCEDCCGYVTDDGRHALNFEHGPDGPLMTASCGQHW